MVMFGFALTISRCSSHIRHNISLRILWYFQSSSMHRPLIKPDSNSRKTTPFAWEVQRGWRLCKDLRCVLPTQDMQCNPLVSICQDLLNTWGGKPTLIVGSYAQLESDLWRICTSCVSRSIYMPPGPKSVCNCQPYRWTISVLLGAVATTLNKS